MNIKRLAHVCLGTTDLVAAKKFYCDILGFKKKFDFVKAGKLTGVYLEITEKTFIEIFKQNIKKREGCPILHLCFEVEDIDKIILHLKSFHLDVTDKKLGQDNSWQSWVTAPDGVMIEFHQYTNKSSQNTGKTCILD